MPTYDIKVKVTYYYQVEADDDLEAEKQGWMYEDHPYSAEVEDITISEQDEEDDEEEVGDLEDE
jgi:hypothetical protein